MDASALRTPVAEDLPKPTARETQQIEGWARAGGHPAVGSQSTTILGKRCLVLLQEHLRRINDSVAADKLEVLHKVTIFLDLNHGAMKVMQYHPSPEWLTSRGYAAELAKGVHISDATRFADPLHQHTQPWCVLHELAHAYHDQVLGFEEPRIKAAWEKYKASGHGDSVLHVDGKMRPHYALTNPMEFFAEMSECYFGTNDFYPFVNGELQKAEPEIYTTAP